MNSKIIYGLAASALLIAFATEALLALQKSRGDEVERTSAQNTQKLTDALAEIGRLKTALNTQRAELTEKLTQAEATIAQQKSQLDAQLAVNAELVKSANEGKRRTEAAAARAKRAAPAVAPAQKSP